MKFYGQDTNRHGARLDVYIEEKSGTLQGELDDANIYDIEPDQTSNVEDCRSLLR